METGRRCVSLFVDVVGDVYVDAGNRVDRWTLATNTSVTVMFMATSCYWSLRGCAEQSLLFNGLTHIKLFPNH